MKTHIRFFGILLFIALSFATVFAQSTIPVDDTNLWTENISNPLFGGTTSGINRAYYPIVIKVGTAYHLWYGDGQNTRHATSTLPNFSDVTFPAPTVSGLTAGAYHPRVLYNASGWTIGGNYYAGPFLMYSTTGSDWNVAPRVVHSADGDAWTDIGACTGVNSYSSNLSVYNFDVVYENATTWKAYADNGSGDVEYWTSTDGLNWTGVAHDILRPIMQSWESDYTSPHVFKIQNTYIMFYGSGGTLSNQGIGLATSTDGQNFTKSDANPIFSTSGTPPAWRTSRTYTPFVIQDNFDWKMYYTGLSATGVYSIGYATNGGFYWTLQEAINAAADGDTINVAEGTYEGFTVSGKTNLTIRGAGNTTLIHPTSLISTGVGHKYDANMSVSVFVNNSTNVTIQNMKIEDNGVTPCGAGTPNAIVFWNASTGTINNCSIHGTYTISGCQTGQGLAVDAGLGQTTTLDVENTNIDGYQKNAIDAVDGNSLTGNPGNITVNVTGGTISGAGSTSAIAQNGILFWNRSGGHVGGSVNGTTISNLEYAISGTTASGIISSGDAVTISNTIFTGVQRYLASMGTGAVMATDNNIFDGINPSGATLEQLATLEDKIDHKMDDNATGFIAIKSGSIIVTPNNLGIQQGYNLASSGNTVFIGPGTYTPTSTILLNKTNITLQGAGTSSTIIKTSQPVGNLFSITGSGTIIENLQVEKTDKTGVQDIIFVNASNVTIRDNLIWGKYVMGDGDVSRAMVVAGGLTGLTVEGNTIYALRQPAYFSNSFGSITNNFVYGTRGWVIEDGNFNFTGNTWGTGSSANYLDIAILATVNPAYYTDIIAMSNANNQANIEDQRPTVRVLTFVYVDSSAIAGGDGTPTKPYQTITPAIPRVVTGGTILVAKGTYNEDVVITKGLNLFSTQGRLNTIVNGQTEGWGGGALRINSSNVTVGGSGKGFTFNSKTSTIGVMLAACYISGARDNIRIEENKFVAAARDPGNNESHALLTDGGQTNQTFINNIFDGMAAPRFLVYVNGFADVSVHSTNIDFIGNTFVSTVGGLSLSSKDGEISGNYFQGAAGLGLSQLANNTITGNYFQGVVNNISANTLSGVDVDAVIASNIFTKKVVIRNAGNYRVESFPWGDFIVVRANIQGAVDAALTGDSVLVSNEIYEEQVEITKDINLRGESMAGTIIKSPVTLTKYFTTSVNNYPIIYLHDIGSPEISNFTIDGAGRGNGNYRFQGIGFRNAGGKVDGCIIKDIRETPINGMQHGVGIYAYADNGTARTLYVSGNTIYGFQKNGTAFNGPNLTAIADNNAITGAGAVNFIAQNCLQIGFGATGSFTNNNISNVSYTPSTDVSCGMLLYQSGGTIQTRNNIVSNTQVGINYINVGGEIKHNNITASAAGVGTTTFWGIVADPGDKQRLNVQPFDMITESVEKPTRAVLSITALTTAVDSNTVIGDGVNGVGIEADALGTETLNFSANENSVSNWGTGFVLYKETDATLNCTLRRNSITGNKFGVLDQTGVLQDAKENWWGSSTGPADPKSLPGIPNYDNPTGIGDSVSSFIDYNPWYLDAGKTNLSIYTLTVYAANGTIEKIPNQTTYNHGATVQLVPNPNEGYHFTNWSGDVTTGHETDNPLSVVMDQNRTITGNFAINIFTLTINSAHGTVQKIPDQLSYDYGTSVQLIPAAAVGYHFNNWTGDFPAGHNLDNPLTVIMNQDRTITADFAIITFTISSSVTGNGTITPSGDVNVNYGANQSFTISANPGHHLDSVVVDGENRGVIFGYTFTNVQANHTIKAYIGVNPTIPTYVISASTGSNGSIFPSGNITVDEGESQLFTITPDPHYHIDSLYVDGLLVTTTSNYSFMDIHANHTIRATFSIDTYTLSITINGSGSVARSPNLPEYGYGSLVQLTAIPQDLSWKFSVWSGDAGGSINPLSVTMDGDKNIGAAFIPDSLYLKNYRSFTAESLALDRDNKNIINKFVQRKPDKVEFNCVVHNNTGKILNDVHFHFSPILILDNIKYPFTIHPVPSQTIYYTKGFIKFIFDAGIPDGDSVEIHGWGSRGKLMTSTYSWREHVAGPHLPTTFTMNQLRYPMPNRVNALYESFKLNGFRDDGGLLVGEARNDAPQQFGWMLATSYTDVLKTLYSKRFGMHTGDPQGFGNFTSSHRPIKGRQKSIPPTKQNNKLLADLVALKVNIAASQLEITPLGFRELIYNDGMSNVLNDKAIIQIETYGDSIMMGYYEGGIHKFADTSVFNNLDRTVRKINSAFEGALDTISFATSLKFKGVRTLMDVSYLKPNQSAIPMRIIPDGNVTPELPQVFTLYQNYPNPFNPTTTIGFDLPVSALVTLKIYNILGQEITTIFDHEVLDGGYQEVEFPANDIPSGVYFYKITAEGLSDEDNIPRGENFLMIKKMILLK
jgi:hypothetical protein